MTKITFVVPYTEKRELVGLINRIVSESDCPDNVRFDILHSKDRVDDSSAYWDSDIVIARGLAYSVLKQERRNFHLIEVPISGIDILKAVRTAASRPGAAHVALFLGRTINVDLKLLEDLCHVNISRYAVDNDDEVLEAFDRLQAENTCDTVVGGYTSCRIAQARAITPSPSPSARRPPAMLSTRPCPPSPPVSWKSSAASCSTASLK